MYEEILSHNPYFNALQEKYSHFDPNLLFDSLTGVLLRNHIIDYANYLINNKIPFAFQIIDLDNFKHINDNYGHQMGDSILIDFGEKLAKSVGNKGLVGRYGGDEFLIIYPNIHSYDDVHKNVTHLFEESGPLRNTYSIGELVLFMTATIGSASYPDDANSYDDLFSKADKALYRGKQKGRNCFIIYVEDKHKDINVTSRNRNALHNTCYRIVKAIEESKDLDDSLRIVNNVLIDALKISNFTLIPKDTTLSKALQKVENELGIYTVTTLEVAAIDCMECHDYMKENGIQSLIEYRVNVEGNNIGSIMMTENKIHRIWQDDDITLLMMIAEIIYYKHIKK